MSGISADITEHMLDVMKGASPVKQALRCFTTKKRHAIGEEIARLLAVEFIREVVHPEWLANPIMVIKKNMTWRMCIDFTDISKSCSKDLFLLPRLGHRLYCWLRTTVFSGCQLRLSPNTDEGVRPRENFFHHAIRPLLLHHHPLRAQERRCNLQTNNAKMPPLPNWGQRRSICRRRRHQYARWS